MKPRSAVPLASGPREIRAAYVDESVATNYVKERFASPIGMVLHQAQLHALQRLIRSEHPSRILELAPGPARLSVEIAASFRGHLTLVDASEAMLSQARKRMTGARSSFVRGDIFALPIRGEFDLAYSFRFIRHFDAPDRARVYEQVARVLRRGALFVFDAVNSTVAEPLRAAAGTDQYPIHDALLNPDQLRHELDRAGFDLVSLTGIQKHYHWLYRLQVLVAPRSRWLALIAMRALAQFPGGQPLEWVVFCRKR